jgi:hypothetical protein
MTLVAGLSIGGRPAFVGDLLTSWRLPTKLTLPTRLDEGSYASTDGYFASGLAQKLVILRPYLMVAWSGSVSVAQNLIRHLDRILPTSIDEFPGNEDALISVLNVLPDSVEVVALLIYKDSIHPLCVHTRGFEIDNRRIYLLGSGRQAFLDFVLPATEVMPDIESDSGVAARAVMINFVANAMMAQYVGEYGLSDSWGGGFEVGYAGDEGFVKVNNILVRCWSLNPDNELGNVGVSFLMHYEGSALHLTSFGNREQTTVVRSWIDSSLTMPLRRTVIPEWTIDLFYRVEDGKHFCAVQNEFPWSKQHAIFHFDEGNLVGWEMDKSRVDKLIKRIAESGEADQFKVSTL